MHTPEHKTEPVNDRVEHPMPQQGADIMPDSPLPDVPDAGDDSQAISPPTPPDISTDRLNADAAIAATTFDDEDDRTLYEQTLDAKEESEQQP